MESPRTTSSNCLTGSGKLARTFSIFKIIEVVYSESRDLTYLKYSYSVISHIF